MSEEKLASINKSVEHVEVSETFKSPAGDAADVVLAKLFTQVESYLQARLPDGFYKQFLIMQLSGLFAIIRTVVGKQLS